MERIEITRPDDWHLHVRDGALLEAVVPHSARVFARALVMPNLVPPVTTTAQALAYRERIVAAAPAGAGFEPQMTLYLTEATPPEEIEAAVASAAVRAVKLYPAGATTHSEAGVTDLGRCAETLEAIAALGLPLCVHGEVADPEVDIFDREAAFLERRLAPLLERHPDLRVVVEHLSTARAVAFVRAAGPRVGATITAHHLLLNRNDLLAGGLRPHHYCLPVLKRESDRRALLEAATSGEPRFFLGTDSAPHPRGAKEAACGCAGVYTAHAALELYAEAFAAAGALERLEGFASRHGAAFYGLPASTERLSLERRGWAVPESYAAGEEVVVPLRAGGEIGWRVAGAAVVGPGESA